MLKQCLKNYVIGNRFNKIYKKSISFGIKKKSINDFLELKYPLFSPSNRLQTNTNIINSKYMKKPEFNIYEKNHFIKSSFILKIFNLDLLKLQSRIYPNFSIFSLKENFKHIFDNIYKNQNILLKALQPFDKLVTKSSFYNNKFISETILFSNINSIFKTIMNLIKNQISIFFNIDNKIINIITVDTSLNILSSSKVLDLNKLFRTTQSHSLLIGENSFIKTNFKPYSIFVQNFYSHKLVPNILPNNNSSLISKAWVQTLYKGKPPPHEIKFGGRLRRKRIRKNQVPRTPWQRGIAKRFEPYARGNKTIPDHRFAANKNPHLLYDDMDKRWMTMWYRQGYQVFRFSRKQKRPEDFERGKAYSKALINQLTYHKKLGTPKPDIANSGVDCVFYNKAYNVWVARWVQFGSRFYRVFSCKHLGFQKAYRYAVKYRFARLKELHIFPFQRTRKRYNTQGRKALGGPKT